MEEYDKARENIDSSITINKKLKNHVGLATAYNNIGYLNELQNNEDDAIEYYLIALEEDKYIENTIGISSDLHTIAAFYEKSGDFENALFYYKRALEVNRGNTLIDREKKDLENIIDILGSMGRIEEKKIYETALKELEGVE